MPNGNKPQQALPDGRNDSRKVSLNAASKLEVRGDLRDIRVLEEALASARRKHPFSLKGVGGPSIRAYQEYLTEILLTQARQSGLYVDPTSIPSLGDPISARTKESEVYVDYKQGKVFKVRNPFAESSRKKHSPSDILYEHIIHNIFFPDTRYTFVGVTDERGELRLVLSQQYVESIHKLSDKETEKAFERKGFQKKDVRLMENEFIEVTDASGQNALARADGSPAFIDPLISHKMPARQIIDRYLAWDPTEKEEFGTIKKQSLLDAVKRFFEKVFLLSDEPEEEKVVKKEDEPDKAVIDEEIYLMDLPEVLWIEELRWMDLKEAKELKEALAQLEATGRYDGVVRVKGQKEGYLLEKIDDGKVMTKRSDRAMKTMLDRYSEGEIRYDGLTFFLTPKQMNEMAVGMPVELKCKETGEYSQFVFSVSQDEIVCRPSFEKTLKEKLYDDEIAKKEGRKDEIMNGITERRRQGIGLRREKDKG